MSLKLNIVNKSRKHITTLVTSKIFENRGGTIGRIEGNDWVLPDPDRIISKKHAVITFKNGTYRIKDVSVNGVYINSPDKEVGQGNNVELRDGDVLFIGDYEISARIATYENPSQIQEPGEVTDKNEKYYPQSVDRESTDPFEFLSGNPNKQEQPITIDKDGPVLGSDAAVGSPAVSDHFPTPELKEEEIIPPDWYKNDKTSDRQVPLPETGDSNNVPYLQAFFKGLGLNSNELRYDINDMEVMEMAGKSFRGLVEGIMLILWARADFKDKFGIPGRTRVGPVGNNPLKFSMSVDDALQYLLLKQSPSYLPPIQAIEEGIQDMKDHQMAIVVAMQEAFEALLKKFDPEILEAEEFSNHSKSKFINKYNKMFKYWKWYCDYYNRLMQDPEESFKTLFGDKFIRAYEDQIQRLMSTRNDK
jgi:type VI secretion system protein